MIHRKGHNESLSKPVQTVDNQWNQLVKILVRKDIDPETGKPFLLRQLTLKGKTYKFSQKQSEFISDLSNDKKFQLFSGGRGCGKSLALCVKMYIICKGFNGITVLLGRKNISDIEKTTLQDFFRLVPEEDYEYRVKDGIINFHNGSKILMMGLDAMQSGNVADMKKAEQKTKSLNIGTYFIDQLEEIDYNVFQKVNDTMRMISPEVSAFKFKLSEEELKEFNLLTTSEVLIKHGILDYPRQGNMTTNPANFWAYHYFKSNMRKNEDDNWVPKTVEDSILWEGSMLDNSDNLPPDFIRDRLNLPEGERLRMVYGQWNIDLLTKGAVFAKEHIKYLQSLVKTPIRIVEGCEIYEEPKGCDYRMGIDPSEGVVDPSSISVVSDEGRKVAKFNGMIPISGLADKVKYLYYLYHKPLIIPESNNAGTALIREIRDLRVYRRKQTEYKTDIETEKLGFRTTPESKALLIQHFQNLLREKKVKLYDRKTIEEMKTFIWSDTASMQGAGAMRQFHDDEVMSTMLAYWEFNPKKVEERLVAQSRPISKKRFQYS